MNKLILQGCNVLIVEDDDFLRRTFTHLLLGSGLTGVFEASNGTQALARLEQHPIDLLITDIQMPEMNGLALLKRIRLGQAACRADLKVIAVTSFSTLEVVTASLSLDVNGFLSKPISAPDVLHKIQVALSEEPSLNHSDQYRHICTNLDSIPEVASPLPASTERASSRPVRAVPVTEPRFEPTTLAADATLSDAGPQGDRVAINRLKPGMRLQEDLVSSSGTVLLIAGAELNENRINRIQELRSLLPASDISVLIPVKDTE